METLTRPPLAWDLRLPGSSPHLPGPMKPPTNFPGHLSPSFQTKGRTRLAMKMKMMNGMTEWLSYLLPCAPPCRTRLPLHLLCAHPPLSSSRPPTPISSSPVPPMLSSLPGPHTHPSNPKALFIQKFSVLFTQGFLKKNKGIIFLSLYKSVCLHSKCGNGVPFLQSPFYSFIPFYWFSLTCIYSFIHSFPQSFSLYFFVSFCPSVFQHLLPGTILGARNQAVEKKADKNSRP